MRTYVYVPMLALIVLSGLTQTATGQIAGLKSRIPSDANAVVIIDTEKLFGSAAAEKGRWEAKRKAAFDAGLTFLTPKATGVVIAAKMDLEFGETIWELAQVRLGEPGDIASVANRFGGAVDNIAGRSASRLPNDSIVVEVTKEIYAAYTPANRQEVARWLSASDRREADDTFSPYIQQAFEYVEKVGTPIIMALDMEGVFSEAEILARLQEGPVAEMPKERQAEIAKALHSIRGAMLGVSVGQGVNGAIRVDFAGDITALKEIGPAMLLRALERQGAMIDDVTDWKAKFSGNTMIVEGPLSESGLRRVMSVLAVPPALAHSMDDMKLSADSDPESLKRVSSQTYYTSVSTLLNDLKNAGRGKSVTQGGVAMWYDKYARKIDNLPILNVDDELLDYGRDVAELLRGGETALKNVGMRSSLREGVNDVPAGYQSYYGDGYYEGYGGYGGYRAGYGYGYGYTSPWMANREKGRTDAIIRQQERTYGAAQSQEMWQAIEKQSAEIRRVMTEKYKFEF